MIMTKKTKVKVNQMNRIKIKLSLEMLISKQELVTTRRTKIKTKVAENEFLV